MLPVALASAEAKESRDGLCSGLPHNFSEIADLSGVLDRDQLVALLGAELKTRAPDEPVVARCPRCRTPIAEVITWETQQVRGRSSEATREIVIAYCSRCGNALGAF